MIVSKIVSGLVDIMPVAFLVSGMVSCAYPLSVLFRDDVTNKQGKRALIITVWLLITVGLGRIYQIIARPPVGASFTMAALIMVVNAIAIYLMRIRR